MCKVPLTSERMFVYGCRVPWEGDDCRRNFLYGYFDESAEAVVQELHRTDAAGNVHDIARMRAMVRCDQKMVHRRDDSFDMPRWLATEMGISSMRSSPAAIRARADRERRIDEDDTKEAARSRSLEWEWDADKTCVALWGSLPADDGTRFINAVERLARRMPVPQETEGQTATQDARRADALVAMASASIAADHSPDKATIIVHTDVDGILDGDKNGVLHGGLPLPPQATELLACDSRVQTVLRDDNGDMFHISSPSYVVPKWIRRQVEQRDDYGCAFWGCGTRAFTDVHHIVPWPKGPTHPSNLILLCRTHHRLVHVFGWHVSLMPDGTAEWFKPDWTPYYPRPAPVSVDP